MSKALNKAQTDLDALKAELEAWIATAPPALPKPARKPAVKRTRAQLIAAATAAPVVLPAAPAAPVEPPQEVDTSWLDLLSPVPAAVVVAAPVEPPHAPEPVPAPLYVDATHLIRIDLTPQPQPVPVRTTPKRKPRTLRQAIRAGGYGN